jgi:pimeloyl-ACP methyl ester carboxylesterase
MKSIFTLVLVILANTTFAQQRVLEGTWLGKLDVGITLRLVMNFAKDETGKYSGTLDSPDQGAKGIKASNVRTTPDSVYVDIASIQGNFYGVFINDTTITGTWSQGPVKAPLTVRKVASVPDEIKPQTPKPPFNYKSEEVAYENASGTVHLEGTFTYPNGAGPFPTAILITGSGMQDRDETMGNHKLFAVIADHLTKQGFAILRVDDRGTGKSKGPVENATTADFASDVEAGLTYLKGRSEVDKTKLGLIGHSEGGLIASIVAAKQKDLNFIVLLAGPGTIGKTLLAEQAEAILVSNGVAAANAKTYKGFYTQIITNAVTSPDTTSAIAKSWKNYLTWKKTTSVVGRAEIGYTDDVTAKTIISNLVQQLSQPWMKYFATSDPAKLLSQTKAKVLALNGSKDLQVLPKQNLAGIKAALLKSKSPLYTTKELKGLNHLFQTCQTCNVQEYLSLEETISPVALNEMATWLNKNVKQ